MQSTAQCTFGKIVVLILLTLCFAGSFEADAGLFSWLGDEQPHTSAEALAKARTLEQAGKLSAARKQYQAVVDRWPRSDEAPGALLAYGKLLENSGDYPAAFNAYDRLMRRYEDAAPKAELFERELRIAESFIGAKKHAWAFGGISAPERALPYLGRILEQDPPAAETARLHYLTGKIHLQLQNYRLAADAFSEVLDRFPDSAVAEDALRGRATSLYYAAREEDTEYALAAEAWDAVNAYVEAFPEKAAEDRFTEMRETIAAQRDRLAYGRSIERYEEEHDSGTFFLSRKPSRDNPAEQLALALNLRAEGREGKALRQLRALVLRWPETDEARTAQFEYAALLEKEGEIDKAFNEYTYLLDTYPGYKRDETLERMLSIAREVMEQRRMSWLFGGFGQEHKAIAPLEELQRRTKGWDRRDEVLFLLGKAYESSDRYLPAADAFETMLAEAPESSLAEEALFSSAHLRYLVSRKHGNDEQAADTAYDDLKLFLETYPDSEQADVAERYLQTLSDARTRRTAQREKRALVQEHEPSRWWFFGRPKRKTPEEQLAYAQRRRDRGKYRSATKHFRAVVRNWPASDEAATAQFEYARMLERRDKYMEAFEAYTELLERYAGRAPHEEVLERQFAIAKRVMHHRRGQFLLFPGFEAPEKAIPLFEKVIKHGPNAPQAPEAQYLVGRAYDMTDQIGMAINAYTKTEYKYPDSEFAEKASFAKAYDLYQLTQESPNDEKLAEGAWAALTLYLNSYPNADNAAEAREYRKALYRRRAKAAYDKAIFYDKLAREPEAALVAYRRFVQQFPHSGWTTLAEIRIQELAAELE